MNVIIGNRRLLACAHPWRPMFLLCLLLSFASGLSAQIVQVESFRGRDVVAGEIIVRFRDGNVTAARERANPAVTVVRPLASSRAVVLRSAARSVSELVEEYAKRPDVAYAEPNYIFRKQDVPSDSFFDSQWGLRNAGQQIAGQTGIAGADIGAVEAWDIAQGSRSVVVGVLDSGANYDHPDLAANMWSAPATFTVVIGGESITCAAGTHGFNAVTRTCDPMDDDTEWHGTHVAGIIGADGDNGLGVSGVSRVANIMALKFLRSDGTGTTSDAIAAIDFAIQAKALFGAEANVRVLNASWGGDVFSQALLDAVNVAADHDMLFVAAAGNAGANTDVTPHYPSSFGAANVISVAATDNRDALYTFSNFGANTVHLGAPGRSVASTQSFMTYRFATGTSLAAPMVSGAASLVLSGCPSLTTAQLKANLLGTVDPLPSLASKTTTGGRLNVYNALVNCAGASPLFTVKTSKAFVPVAAGGTHVLEIAASGLSSNVALTVSAPSGISVSLGSPTLTNGSPATSVTIHADGNVSPGAHIVHLTGTGGGVSRTTGLLVMVASPVSPGQIIQATWSEGASQPDRFRPANLLPPGVMEWYHLDQAVTAMVDISLSCSCPGRELRLLDSSGGIIETRDSNAAAQISRSLDAGTYFIVASTGPVATLDYSLAVSSPQLVSLDPDNALRGSSLSVQLRGTQFEPGLSIDAGSDIAVSDIVVTDSRTATATFAISPAAVPGARPVRVITSAGTSNAVTFTVTLPTPVITSVTPLSAVTGTTLEVTIAGSEFINPVVTVTSSAGVSLENVDVTSTTTIVARIAIPAGGPGSFTIAVHTAGGVASQVIQILPPPPAISSINPPAAGLGTVVDVSIVGTNFFAPVAIDAGSGISVTNLTIAPDASGVSARFSISPGAAMGVRDITVTAAGGTSAPVGFTVTAGVPPSLTSLSPASGGRGTTRHIDVRGTNLIAGFTLDAGPDIAVTAITLASPTQAFVTLEIGSNAALGPRDITVTTQAGTSNPLTFTVLLPPPTLSSITPSSAAQASTVSVAITGTNFFSGLAFEAGTLDVTQVVVLGPTSASAVLTVPANTPTGVYDVIAVTESGSSAPIPFTVVPGVPTLSEIEPPYGIRGHDVRLLLRGTNFAAGATTLSAISGVQVISLSVGVDFVEAMLRIAPNAPIGPQAVSLVTPGGQTNPLQFSIFDPFPDLYVTAGPPLNDFYPGINGTYSLTVGNRGLVGADDFTVTDLLPPELTFLSGGNLSYSCSATGQLVSCKHSGPPLNATESHSFTITVAIAASAPPALTHTVAVAYPEDLYPANNNAVGVLPVIQELPVPILSFSEVSAGQQASATLTLPNALPHDVTGTLQIHFVGNGSADDPAVEFATGGRVVSFTIPANTLAARFANTPGSSISFQAGTTAGSISFDGTIRMGALEKSFSSAAGVLTIAPSPPVIENVRTQMEGGFAALITAYSTPRSITGLMLEFFTIPSVQLSCGGVAGCSVSGNVITFDVTALFDSWFAAGAPFGSISVLRLPLAIQGSVGGAVTVTLRNALGVSNSVSFPLP